MIACGWTVNSLKFIDMGNSQCMQFVSCSLFTWTSLILDFVSSKKKKKEEEKLTFCMPYEIFRPCSRRSILSLVCTCMCI